MSPEFGLLQATLKQLMSPPLQLTVVQVPGKTGKHFVSLHELSGPQLPLKLRRVQPHGGPVTAAAGDVRLSMITGAVQAAAPATAAPLIMVRRSSVRRSLSDAVIPEISSAPFAPVSKRTLSASAQATP
jgi:hypothetical protein